MDPIIIGMDITSANAISRMIVDKLFPAGFPLEQFSTDQAISQDNIQITETRMGVDGRMVAGVIPGISIVNFSLEASSPTTKYLWELYDAMMSTKQLYLCHLISEVPSIKSVFKWMNGVLQTGSPTPAQKKVLDPTTWTFHFESFERSQL
jgi:hypothetical protein